jgi:hypothetical protein
VAKNLAEAKPDYLNKDKEGRASDKCLAHTEVHSWTVCVAVAEPTSLAASSHLLDPIPRVLFIA